jgi:hypothetical protein
MFRRKISFLKTKNKRSMKSVWSRQLHDTYFTIGLFCDPEEGVVFQLHGFISQKMELLTTSAVTASCPALYSSYNSTFSRITKDCIHLFFNEFTVICWTLAAFFSFVILYTPGTGDQPVSRPTPTHRTTQRENKRKQTSIPRVGFEPTTPMCERVKTIHAYDRVAAVIDC